jgi:hypothetical protein
MRLKIIKYYYLVSFHIAFVKQCILSAGKFITAYIKWVKTFYAIGCPEATKKIKEMIERREIYKKLSV